MFITCQLRALEDFLVFEVMWEVTDLVWKVLSRSGDLPDILHRHVGWMLENPVGRHVPRPKVVILELP